MIHVLVQIRARARRLPSSLAFPSGIAGGCDLIEYNHPSLPSHSCSIETLTPPALLFHFITHQPRWQTQ
jgi:hypothetical protein